LVSAPRKSRRRAPRAAKAATALNNATPIAAAIATGPAAKRERDLPPGTLA